MKSGGRETHLHVNEICGGKQISNVSSPDGCFSSPPMEKRVNDDHIHLLLFTELKPKCYFMLLLCLILEYLIK